MTAQRRSFYFGIAGWSYPDWAGIVYPSLKPRGFDQLVFLTQFFDAIELNNTFYRIPESKMVENWARRVHQNPKFRFTAKLYQGFTHGKEDLNEKEVTQYRKAIEPLVSADRLGCLLAQFPVSFRNEPENQRKLKSLAQSFREYSLVVEFRHRSWVEERTLEWMEEEGIGFCNVDEPLFRKMVRPAAIVTSPVAYVRFHGRNYQTWFAKDASRDSRYDYLYSEDELDEWIPRIKEMGEKATNTFVIGNNHFRGQAPANILELRHKTTREPVVVPETMLESFPQLKKIAKKRKTVKGQASLFE